MSVKIYKTTDRIPVKFGDITIHFSVLTKEQKTALNGCTIIENGEKEVDVNEATWLAIKYGVKDIEGVEYATGGEFKLNFEDDKQSALTDESVNELVSMNLRDDLYLVAFQFVKGVPDEITHPITGKSLKGVKVLPGYGLKNSGN